MAVAAVDLLVTGVVPVIELDRLLDRVLHAARERTPHVTHYTQEPSDCSATENEKRETRERIVSRPKQ